MIKKEDLKRGIRYRPEEIAHLMPNKFSGRPAVTHFRSMDELDENNQRMFQEIAITIRARFPEIMIFAAGSRSTDFFREDSDYDIIVIADKETVDEIKNMDFTVKVDVLSQYGVRL